MTCQWCKNYRRRGGAAVCSAPGRDGAVIAAGRHVAECEWFSPRRTCTTCEHRCSLTNRPSSVYESGSCSAWELRSVSSWGGDRRSRNALASGGKNRK